MSGFRASFTKKLSKNKNKSGNKKSNGKIKKTFKLKWTVNDFKNYFAQNSLFVGQVFQTFFDRLFVLWERSEYQLEFKKREHAILNHLGLKNDFLYVQLLSDLGEFGLDLQTFLILCIDALLNQDEKFKDVILYLIMRRQKLIDLKHGKEIYKQLLEQKQKDVKNFEKFSYEMQEK